jgi:hypothetical protein
MSTLHAETIERTDTSRPLTADGLLRRRASQRPGVIALSDPPNLEALGFGPPKSLSYREVDTAVDALASFFIELGLEPGDTIAVQLPNLALSPLTLLAAWRAGLTVAALPMLWRAHEIAKACEEVAPKALIGVSSFAGENYAETLCAIAVSQISVRFVLGFGRGLPDGVASLDEAKPMSYVVVANETAQHGVMLDALAATGFPGDVLVRQTLVFGLLRVQPLHVGVGEVARLRGVGGRWRGLRVADEGEQGPAVLAPGVVGRPAGRETERHVGLKGVGQPASVAGEGGLDEAFLLMASEDRLLKAVNDAADRMGGGHGLRYLEDEEDWD